MASLVCSMTHRWIAFTSSTVSRGVRRFPPRSTPSLGRVIWPIPYWRTDPAFAGSNAPLASTSWRFCCQTASVCATFSSSVMRDSRSATRRSTGSEASLYAGALLRGKCQRAHHQGRSHEQTDVGASSQSSKWMCWIVMEVEGTGEAELVERRGAAPLAPQPPASDDNKRDDEHPAEREAPEILAKGAPPAPGGGPAAGAAG